MRCSVARRTRSQARLVGIFGRDICAHSLQRRIFIYTMLPGMAERTLIIDGFSKSFAMTGWRLGYTVAPPEVIPALAMMAINTYTCVAEFTQYAAIDALRDRENNTPRMVGEFSRRREQFARDLNRVPGFRCLPPEGAFYAWVDITGTGISAEELCRILLEDAGVAAIPDASARPARSSSASRLLRRWRRYVKRSSASRKFRPRGRVGQRFVERKRFCRFAILVSRHIHAICEPNYFLSLL